MTGDKPKNEQGQGRLVVLLGPSAVGKSTVVHRLREEIPQLYFSVSMTTRDPRPGEVDGRDYFYVTREEFQEKIDAGEMLEWADIHGGLQRSGTPAGPVRDALSEGRPVLVEVDIVGARNVARMMPEANTCFWPRRPGRSWWTVLLAVAQSRKTSLIGVLKPQKLNSPPKMNSMWSLSTMTLIVRWLKSLRSCWDVTSCALVMFRRECSGTILG